MVNDKKEVGKYRNALHIGPVPKDEPYYEDVKNWIKGGKSPNGKIYKQPW